MDLRQSVFAGSWYPLKATDCAREIDRFLKHGIPKPQTPAAWIGGIVPHAGWYYSGQIACNVIDWLKDDTPPEVVVLFGMHLHAASANHLMPAGAWQTPFGAVPVAEELANHLLQRFDFQIETADRFVQDNTIELQLPFVKYLLDPEAVLGIGVAPNPKAAQIGQAAADWARENGRRIKIIGSTDLTHYGPNYGFTPKGTGPQAVDWVRHENDRKAVEAFLAMAPQRIIDGARQNQNTCCAGAIAAAVSAIRQMGATATREVAYATSYDKSPGESFVGYAGVVFG
jgi:AmmeMemoRadiSam system protein B